MFKVKSYAAVSATEPLQALEIERREPGTNDVVLKVLYCGVCHTDIHYAKNDLGASVYPVVPGHEIVGVVERVGANVTRFQANDNVGVGCMVDSCRKCESCQNNFENLCNKTVYTYATALPDGTQTYGGYSKYITVHQDFVLSIPKTLPLDKAAPLLCAGITTYSPLRFWKVLKGQKVGVVGLGGLGHMGIKFAAAMGAHVTVISTSPSKKNDALALGAHDFIVSSDEQALTERAKTFDFILDTVSAEHNVMGLVNLLKAFGRYVLVGLLTKPIPLSTIPLLMKNIAISGSTIGGIKETQEMLDFCGEHNITPEIEVIPIDGVNRAYERVLKSDVKYRFVIDMSTLN